MKNKNNIFLIILFFLFFNFIFNFRLWRELFGSKIMISDNLLTEYLAETSYQNILHFKNPFITKSIFYPFTINFSMNDSNSAYVLPFFILRPFLNPHKCLLLITLIGFLLNNLIMYILLRKLKIRQNLSILIALIFGFTPFLSHRIMGHYTYIPIYFFPLVFLLTKIFVETNRSKTKYIISGLFGLILALILLTNFYYLFTVILGLSFFIGYWFFYRHKDLWLFIKKNFKYFFISVSSMLLFLSPWILSVYQLIKTQGLVKTPGFGGSMNLSSSIFSFFTPSEYNPIYKVIISKIAQVIPLFSKYENFYLNSWEKFVYPGIIILVIYVVIMILKILKKLPIELWNKIKPYFHISIFFAILTLGPFFKIFNRWMISLDGVLVVFPLPFLLLHYIPGLSTIRVPTRFTPAMIFLACLVIAIVLEYLLKKVNKKKQLIIIICLFFIFTLDQFYVIPHAIEEYIPTKIYSYIKNQPQGTVLEVPFTVRDGFQYIGFVHATQPMYGQLIHNKPIIGGYMPRVNQSIFDYYNNLKFIGYLSKIIDKGNYNPLKEKPREPVVTKFPYQIKDIKKELDLHNVKYIILKNNEAYTNIVKNLIVASGYCSVLQDSQYELYKK